MRVQCSYIWCRGVLHLSPVTSPHLSHKPQYIQYACSLLGAKNLYQHSMTCCPLHTCMEIDQAENCLRFLIITLRLLRHIGHMHFSKESSIHHMFALPTWREQGPHTSPSRWEVQSNSWVRKWVVSVNMEEMDALAGCAGGNFPCSWPCRDEASYQLFTLWTMLCRETTDRADCFLPHSGFLSQSEVSFVSQKSLSLLVKTYHPVS